jgi:hypothetical protein
MKRRPASARGSRRASYSIALRGFVYNYFGRHPEKVLAFFDKHMKQAVDRKKMGVEERAVA